VNERKEESERAAESIQRAALAAFPAYMPLVLPSLYVCKPSTFTLNKSLSFELPLCAAESVEFYRLFLSLCVSLVLCGKINSLSAVSVSLNWRLLYILNVEDEHDWCLLYLAL
jgi:hypothetical protein